MAPNLGGQSKACFRSNEAGGWDFYPWPETRLGYRIDNAAKLKLEQIERQASHLFWLLPALPLFGVFCVTDAGEHWLADVAPGMSSPWALPFCLLLCFALSALGINLLRRRQIAALADFGPSIVVLSPGECRRNIARQVFFGHPKIYAALGALYVAVIIWVCTYDWSHSHVLLLVTLPSALYVLRAWRLIFSAAEI